MQGDQVSVEPLFDPLPTPTGRSGPAFSRSGAGARRMGGARGMFGTTQEVGRQWDRLNWCPSPGRSWSGAASGSCSTRSRARAGRTAAQAAYLYAGLEVRLQRARLPVTADRFVTEGALVGAGLALLSLLATWFPRRARPDVPVRVRGDLGHLRGRRDALAMDYNAGVALAASQISNAWLAQPSLGHAMDAVITYGHPEVARDFEAVRAALGAGKNLAEAFTPVADRRRSPFLDGLAMALISADHATGDIRGLLDGIAESTREQVEIFKDYLVASANAPGSALGGVRALGVGAGVAPDGAPARRGRMQGGELEGVFHSPVGAIMLFVAGWITLAGYLAMQRAIRQGIVMDRILTEEG
ncbi:MAG: type II secretion system F family protein [Anaerolineae bacterium]|nr:type II secretion system F family protein [Anaerolineae bacterium]